jgi:cell division protein FtsQ
VSRASAARFAARVRARRWRRAGIVTVVFLAVTATGWAVLGAPWARVERIRVTGTVQVPQAEVDRIAGAQIGVPMLLVDTSAVARQVRGITLVRSTTVTRRWPSTLVVQVRERTAAAAVPVRGGFSLVDVDGVEVGRAAKAPTQLPVVRVELAGDGVDGLRAVLSVLDQLPADLRGEVRESGTAGVDGVWTVHRDGARVLWGSAEDVSTKVRALRALRALPRKDRPASKLDYDVSAPQAPAVRART